VTWAEFKAEMAKLGVKDEDVLWYIDVNFPRDGNILIYRREEGLIIEDEM
jgi:hypothetical protein